MDSYNYASAHLKTCILNK